MINFKPLLLAYKTSHRTPSNKLFLFIFEVANFFRSVCLPNHVFLTNFWSNKNIYSRNSLLWFSVYICKYPVSKRKKIQKQQNKLVEWRACDDARHRFSYTTSKISRFENILNRALNIFSILLDHHTLLKPIWKNTNLINYSKWKLLYTN